MTFAKGAVRAAVCWPDAAPVCSDMRDVLACVRLSASEHLPLERARRDLVDSTRILTTPFRTLFPERLLAALLCACLFCNSSGQFLRVVR